MFSSRACRERFGYRRGSVSPGSDEVPRAFISKIFVLRAPAPIAQKCSNRCVSDASARAFSDDLGVWERSESRLAVWGAGYIAAGIMRVAPPAFSLSPCHRRQIGAFGARRRAICEVKISKFRVKRAPRAGTTPPRTPWRACTAKGGLQARGVGRRARDFCL